MSYEMKQVGHGLRAGYEPGGNLEIECLWPDESRLMPRGVRVVVQRADVPDLLRAIMGGKDYERTVAPRLLAELGGASVDRPFTDGPPIPPAPIIPDPMRCLGRVASIAGFRVTISGSAPGAFTKGMRIVGDDDKQGRSPRAGYVTVISVTSDGAFALVDLDGLAAANIVHNDYLFEKPPTAEELHTAEVDRRLTALEKRAAVAPSDPAALLRAAIAKWAPAARPCSPDGLLQLAQALEAVRRAEGLAESAEVTRLRSAVSAAIAVIADAPADERYPARGLLHRILAALDTAEAPSDG